MTACTRPVLRYHGGKWMLAPWLLQFFPPHRIYVEPFGGGGSVLMRKPRAYAEVYNDLDADVVALFRVLRDPVQAAELDRLLRLTPWSRDEFYASYEAAADPVEQARRTVTRCFMAFGTTSRRANRTGFRAKAYRQNQTGVQDWVNYPEALAAFTDRLRGVTIENRDAALVLRQQDTPETLHYCDPPYVNITRSALKWDSLNDRAYAHEMTDDDHRALAGVIRQLEGMVVLSGYPCDLYDVELYPDWERHERKHRADRARARTEVIWLNAACVRALRAGRSQQHLFAGGGA